MHGVDGLLNAFLMRLRATGSRSSAVVRLSMELAAYRAGEYASISEARRKRLGITLDSGPSVVCGINLTDDSCIEVSM
jgi:hypothetical protein